VLQRALNCSSAEEAHEFVVRALNVLASRGSDSFGASNLEKTKNAKTLAELEKNLPNGKNIIAHNLHAIVNKIPQPLKNSFVANCEIYNWKTLGKAKNDADALLNALKNGKLGEADGDFAIAFHEKGKTMLARDVFGVKPIFYLHTKKGFFFSSENKVLNHNGKEVKPGTIVTFDGKKISEKEYYKLRLPKETKLSREKIQERLASLLDDAFSKRIKGLNKVGILFSGGIDSTLLAFLCQKNKIPFILYVAGGKESKDVVEAKRVAKYFGWKLRIANIDEKNVAKLLPTVVKTIESNNYVKVSVAIPLFAASALAKKDKQRVILSGIGSEELFAGYERHGNAGVKGINKECLNGLQLIHERDLFRDDVITMHHHIELRVPFLDRYLAEFALSIPSKYKIVGDQKKVILREAALLLGLPEQFVWRKKLAAQYGSRSDKILQKLAKKKGFKSKRDFVESFS